MKKIWKRWAYLAVIKVAKGVQDRIISRNLQGKIQFSVFMTIILLLRTVNLHMASKVFFIRNCLLHTWYIYRRKRPNILCSWELWMFIIRSEISSINFVWNKSLHFHSLSWGTINLHQPRVSQAACNLQNCCLMLECQILILPNAKFIFWNRNNTNKLQKLCEN